MTTGRRTCRLSARETAHTASLRAAPYFPRVSAFRALGPKLQGGGVFLGLKGRQRSRTPSFDEQGLRRHVLTTTLLGLVFQGPARGEQVLFLRAHGERIRRPLLQHPSLRTVYQGATRGEPGLLVAPRILFTS